jgi:AraC-like DNA-binding protein
MAIFLSAMGKTVIFSVIFAIQTISASVGFLLEPKPATVIRKNVFRLKADVDKSKTVKEVQFFARYRGGDYTKGYYVKMIGTSVEFPWEYYWDVTEIPDQDQARMQLWCVIDYTDGSRDDGSDERVKRVVLDRNPAISQRSLVSEWSSNLEFNFSSISDLEQVVFPDSFICGESMVRLKAWNSAETLALLTWVEDLYVFNLHTPAPDNQYMIWAGDCISYGFEVDNAKRSILHENTRTSHVAPTGFSDLNADDSTGKWSITTTIFGTLNDTTDVDTGYFVLVKIPFTYLGDTIKGGLKMGFNISVIDAEVDNKKKLSSDWGGNNCNPSEWGHIVLAQRPPMSAGLKAFYVMLAFFICIIIIVLARRLKVQADQDITGKTSEDFSDPLVKDCINLIGQHYRDCSFSSARASESLNVSKGYLGKKFKSGTGINFNDYLNQVRIESIKKELRETRKDVSQISYDNGFDKLNTFFKAFKRHVGMTPLDYQKKAQQEK